MVLLLDTSVLVCYGAVFEDHYYRSRRVILNEPFSVSETVVSEYCKLRKRRKDIYSRIPGFEFQENLTPEDIHRRCLRAGAGRNENDERHVDNIYHHVIDETRLDPETALSRTQFGVFMGKMHTVVRGIKVKMGQLEHDLTKNSKYQEDHVFLIVETTGFKKLRKVIMKNIPNANQNKVDVKIFVEAISFAYDNNLDIVLVTDDSFFLRSSRRLLDFARQEYANTPTEPSIDIHDIDEY